MATALVILAAGKGTRMQSDLPKVLHKFAGASLLHHAILSAGDLDPERTIVVAGHGIDEVRNEVTEIDPSITVVEQTEQLGTGHAVLCATEALSDFNGLVMVLYGDTPLLRSQTLLDLADTAEQNTVTVLGFNANDPARYGRLVTDGSTLDRIVEFKDASPAELDITLCNSGVLAAQAKDLFPLLERVTNENASGEFYLPDIVGLARNDGQNCGFVACSEDETLGVNSRVELAQAADQFQKRARRDALEIGVTLEAQNTVQFAFDTVIGRDCVIEANVVFGPGVTVESGAHLRAFSHFEGCHISRGAVVGPYARLRPGTELSEDVSVGNFVEIKNAIVAEGAKVNHLSYIGDATVGERTNIGAGTITCNYDGVFKHQTKIGADVFIGSNTMLVAPVELGDRTMTASGTVVTEDVPSDALSIGRTKQVNKPGMATKLMSRLKALKKKKVQ